jgi:hypothetical protein
MVPFAVITLAVLLVVLGGGLAIAVPHLGTLDAVLAIAFFIAIFAFGIWVARRGGRWGGWGNSGRMGN